LPCLVGLPLMVTAMTTIATNPSSPPTNGMTGSTVQELRIADWDAVGFDAPPGTRPDGEPYAPGWGANSGVLTRANVAPTPGCSGRF
jgi:hypothetical protein